MGGHVIGSNPTGDVCHYGTLLSVAGARLKELCSKLSDVTIRDDQWVTALVEVTQEGRNQDDEQSVVGSGIVELPSRT